MPYNLPKAWSAGFALPPNVRDEGLKRHAFTTQPAPSGTYDNPQLENAAYRSGFAIPQYVLNEGYGGGAYVTKWAKRGSYFGPKIPPFLDAPANRVLQSSPASGGGTAVTVQALNGLGGVPDAAPLPAAYARYGQQAASLVLKHIKQQPAGKRNAALKSMLGRIDPTLYARTKKLANANVSMGLPPGVALHHGLAQAMGTGILNEVIQVGKSGQQPAAQGQLGLGCYGVRGSGSALGSTATMAAVAASERAGSTPTAISTSVPSGTAPTINGVVDPSFGTTPYMMAIVVGGANLIVPASFMYYCSPGDWIQADATGTAWTGPNPDGTLTPAGAGYNFEKGPGSSNGNYIMPTQPGVLVANASGFVRSACYRQYVMPSGYVAGPLEVVTPIDANNVLVQQYVRGYHQSMYDDVVDGTYGTDMSIGSGTINPNSGLLVAGPYIGTNFDPTYNNGEVDMLGYQTSPPQSHDIDTILADNRAPDVTWTDPSQIPPGLAAEWAAAAVGENTGDDTQYGNFFSVFTNGQLADYARWMNALGVPGTGPDDAHTNYYTPMLNQDSGSRLRPFAKFINPLCAQQVAEMYTTGQYSVANGDPATPDLNAMCGGWGLYLTLNTKNVGAWSPSNPYVLRLFIATEPETFWDAIWAGLKTLAADIVHATEDVLDDLGKAACALLNNPGSVAGAKAAAGKVGQAGALIAGAACGGQPPPPVAPPFDWTPVILAGGVAILMIAIVKKKKKKVP